MALDSLRVPPYLQRPSSSHSNRSVSRASQRSTSRLSQRTIIKQPRLVVLLKALVQQVTKVNEGDVSDDIREDMDTAIKRIDQMKQGPVPDLAQLDAQIRGHVEKARINIQDSLADTLTAKYAEIKGKAAQRNDLDMDMKLATLPSHLYFLLLLSSPPTPFTLSQVDSILAGKHDPDHLSQPLTWEAILKEEPFQGQHWQGAYGLPMGSTVENWDEESTDSPALSLLDDAEYSEDASSHDSIQPIFQPKPFGGRDPFLQSDLVGIQGRGVIDALCNRQYWRSGWRTDAHSHQRFDIGMPSSLGPISDRIMIYGSTPFTRQDDFIDEVDAVRDVLMMLQGRKSCLFDSKPGGHDIQILQGRRIVHLTSASQKSILRSFAAFASTLNHLRHLVRHTASSLPLETRCRTSEAFSAAVGHQLHAFDLWCARIEEHINLAQQGKYGSGHIVSLLSLEQRVSHRLAGSFVILLDVIRIIESRNDRITPSAMCSLILNTLLEAIRARLTVNDTTTVKALADVLRASAEPLWSNLGKWLRDGIPIRAGFADDHHKPVPTWDEKEFFIRINPLMDIGDPEFWDGGYTLPPRHTIPGTLNNGYAVNEDNIPIFLVHVAHAILEAGKAVGLLRALDMVHLVGDNWLKEWTKFEFLTKSLPLEGLGKGLEDLISDTLLRSCRLVQSSLQQILIEECDLWKHLQGLENVCLMTRGDAMSHFVEKLFARMDSRQPWNDFHFLNTAFREVIQLGSQEWISTSLVRFSYRGNKDHKISMTMKAIDGLAIEYAVPFPLTYLFGPESSVSYSSLFCFLLQIRRGKSVLDSILIRGLNGRVLDINGLKAFHALRGKLSWFVNTFMSFIMTNVIHAGLLEFHKVLRNAVSLDEMISLHRIHLEQLMDRCLLSNNSAIHKAILSILDLTLQFGECLSAFAGDTSLHISGHSSLMTRRKGRRQGRKRRIRHPDLIGFAEALPPSEEDSDSECDGAKPSPIAQPESDFTASLAAEDGFFSRLERISLELDGLMRFVRHGVDSLAAGAGNASVTFGILAFYLEDWDM